MSSFVQSIRKNNKEKQDRLFQKMEGKNKLMFHDPALTWVCGGLSRGRANLVYGPRGSFKTSICLVAAGIEQQNILKRLKEMDLPDCQEDGTPRALVLIYDSEYAHGDPRATDQDGEFTPEARLARMRYSKAGIDPDRLVLIQSNEIKTLFAGSATLKKDLTADPFLVAAVLVDSWGAIQSEQAKGKIEDNKSDEAGNSFGGNSKTIGVMVSFLLNIAAENGVTNFWVQHCMENLEYAQNPALPKYKLVGGQKLQLLVHSTLFLEGTFSKDSHLLDGNEISQSHADAVYKVGKKIFVRCDKSRFVPEGRKCDFYMNANNLQFANPEYSLFNLACKLHLFDVKGAWYYYPKDVPNPGKWNGGDNLMSALRDDKNLYNRLLEDCFNTTYTDALGGAQMSTVLLEKDEGENDNGKEKDN